MFASIRCYFVHKVPTSEIVRRVDEEFIDLISRQPGFIAYEFLDGGGGDTMTISTFEEAGQAEASRELVRDWTESRLQDVELTLTEALRGEVLLRRSAGGAPTQADGDTGGAYAAVRRYRTPLNVRDLILTAGARFADRVAERDGFLDYRVLDCGTGQLLSISTFSGAAAAQASDSIAAMFVRDQMSQVEIYRTDMVGGGNVVLSRGTGELVAPAGA